MIEQPYFPFLKNIATPKNASEISENGCTECCSDCYLFLKSQWDHFNKIQIPQVERVYRTNKTQSAIVPTTIESNTEISCYICSKKTKFNSRKRIYCNTGANMNLGFLKSFHCKNDGYYSIETGETFTCLSCFEELKQHWLNYRSTLFGEDQNKVIKQEVIECGDDSARVNCEDVAGNCDDYIKNEFFIESCENKENTSSKSTSRSSTTHIPNTRSKSFSSETSYMFESCPVCLTTTTSMVSVKVFAFTEPFFPLLKQYLSSRLDNSIFVCHVCAVHLHLQWDAYVKKGIEVDKRVYNTEKLQCCECKLVLSRTDISVKYVEETNKHEMEYSKCDLICGKCKHSSTEYNHISELKDTIIKSEQFSRLPKELEQGDNSVNSNSGMKATATVSPFLNFNMRSHAQEHLTPTTSNSVSGAGGGNDEVSFAAALRKLAQQTPAPHSSQMMNFNSRDRRMNSPPSSKGGDSMMFHHPSHEMHIGGTPSIMAPVIPPSSMHMAKNEKDDRLIISPFSAITPRDVRDKHKENLPMPMFRFREQEEMMHHRRSHEQRHIDHHPSHVGFDERHNSPSANALLSNNSFKERSSSSIGLVHPQPVRKLHEEEPTKTTVMNSLHYPPRDTVPSIHSLSPSEMSRFAPFPVPSHQQQHSHGAQSSCPVHGHEREHQHEERNNRPPPSGLPFDLPSHFPREVHSIHGQHPRLREELQFLHGRHPAERKEHLPSHHAFEEDFRRRGGGGGGGGGMDYRWAGLPPHLLDEQYRRQLLNGHEHQPGFKEQQHGKMFAPPFYYNNGREHPLHVDPFLQSPHGLPPTDLHHRHGPPVSPRILDYYRREHAQRSRAEFEHHERRHSDERREKDLQNDLHRKSVDMIKRKQEDILLQDRRKHNSSRLTERNHIQEPTRPVEKKMPNVPIFKGLDFHLKNNKALEPNPHQINSIIHSKLPDPKTELAAASILANMNRMNQSPCSDEVESLTSSSGPENPHLKPVKIEQLETPSNEPHFTEEKENYMLTLGLVSQTRKRALEEENERKRWERKFRKFRGRPKKRSKRENTEESSINGDQRSSSELDFYSGPMTRHKQQLLQEQESLLEQIQKRNSVDEMNDENANLIKCDETTNNNDSVTNDRTKEPKSPNTNSPNQVNSTNNSPLLTSNNNDDNKTLTNENTSNIKAIKETFISSNETPSELEQQSRFYDILREKQRINSPTVQEQFDQQSQKQQQHILEQRHLTKHLNNEYSKHASQSMELTKQLQQPVQHPFDLPRHPMELTKHFNGRHPLDFHEDIKTLDNTLFGRCMDGNGDSFARWPGIEPLAHAYTAYMAEHDIQRQHVLQSFEELQRDGRCLHQKREYLEKDTVVYNERRIHIAEKRREMRHQMDMLHRALRTMSSL